jgi:hypothetical protein
VSTLVPPASARLLWYSCHISPRHAAQRACGSATASARQRLRRALGVGEARDGLCDGGGDVRRNACAAARSNQTITLARSGISRLSAGSVFKSQRRQDRRALRGQATAEPIAWRDGRRRCRANAAHSFSLRRPGAGAPSRAATVVTDRVRSARSTSASAATLPHARGVHAAGTRRPHMLGAWRAGGSMEGWTDGRAAAGTRAANEPRRAMRCDAARAALPHRSIVGASARLRIDAPCTTSCRRNAARWPATRRRRRADGHEPNGTLSRKQNTTEQKQRQAKHQRPKRRLAKRHKKKTATKHNGHGGAQTAGNPPTRRRRRTPFTRGKRAQDAH